MSLTLISLGQAALGLDTALMLWRPLAGCPSKLPWGAPKAAALGSPLGTPGLRSVRTVSRAGRLWNLALGQAALGWAALG